VPGLRFFLGLDAGGTKCDAVLLDGTGVVHGWGTGGPANYRADAVVRQSYRDALAGAFGDLAPPAVTVGTVGWSPAVPEWFGDRGIEAAFHHAGEVEAGFAAALEDWGLLALAGTGSFVHARTPDGRDLHLGGLGPILGDEGSAYDLGLRGLRAMLRSTWPGARPTSLPPALLQALDEDSVWGVVWPFQMHRLGRRDIAVLAPVVEEQARAGDAVALDILRAAASDLADIIAIALDGVGLRGTGCPVIGIGGLAQGSALYWRILAEEALGRDPSLRPVMPPVRPAVGAALVAMRAAGLLPTADLRARVVETQRAFPRALVAAAEGPTP
jgi:N-acetylglucosamine kinase-like BadF-type ATPase